MKYLEDYKVGDIDRFGSYHMTNDEVIEFATRFDPQPFHVDEVEAATHPLFKGLVASGWHTAAATMRMIVDRNRELGLTTLGSPGVEGMSWPVPVYPNDMLSVQSEVLDVRRSKSRPEMGFVKIRNTTVNQKGKVVLTFTANVMISARPAN